MTRIIDTAAKRSLSAKLAAGFAISAMFALGISAVPANARGHYHYYNSGYYRTPPVVYGSPYGGILRWLTLLPCPAGGLRPEYRHKLAVCWHRHSVSSAKTRDGNGRQHCRSFSRMILRILHQSSGR